MADLPESSLAYTMAGVRRSNPYDARRRFASQLLQSGSDTSPIMHPLQGAARLAQALAGGYIGSQVEQQEQDAIKAEKADSEKKLAAVMAEPDPEKRIQLAAAVDPKLGLQMTGQLAVEQAKQGNQRKMLESAANSFGSSYGLPTGQANTAIASIESGGLPNNGYGAVGNPADAKGSRAQGRYQVMDYNVGPWTKEILGREMTPQEFLASPQAQDAVFNAKFGQYVQQYGSPEAASRAWFAGPGGMNNPTARDVNGMTVQGYGQKFAQAYGPGAGGPQIPQGSADGMPPQPTPQGVTGPTLQAPALPQRLTPKDLPQEIKAQFIDRFRRGGYGPNPAEAETRMVQDMQRFADASFESQKLEYSQKFENYKDERKRSADALEHDRRERSKPPTEGQSLSSGFADRMTNSNGIIAQIGNAGTSKVGRMLEGSIFGVGIPFASGMQSDEYRQYMQARDDFINAQLRRESGAAIGANEYANADRQYFPQPGDDPKTIQQKALNRQLAVEGMIRNAGQSYQPSPTIVGGGGGGKAIPPPPPGFRPL